MTKPPDWPFRCPIEGWYLSNVEAVFEEDLGLVIEVRGRCKQHEYVTVTDPRAYAPDLWSTVEEQ